MSARNPSTSLRFLTRRMSEPFVFPLAGHLDKVLSVAEGERKERKYSAAALTDFGEAVEDGSVRSAPTPSTYTSFYTGKPEVAGLGHAFLFRNYRASLAKWQTADPLGYPDGWNQLAYGGNAAISSLDPDGTSLFDNWFDDAQGKFIFDRWLDGSGDAYISWDDPFWADYMKANELLANQVWRYLHADATKRYIGGNFDGAFSAEIQNGYKTGYELLHGTVKHKGDFQLFGMVDVSYSEGKRIVTYNLYEVWNDIIDPNSSYFSDMLFEGALKIFYNPKDYDIQIAWNREWRFVFE